jgi:hypothetical protein
MKLTGEMVQVSLGDGVKQRMVFRTAQRVKIMLDPTKETQYCIPREDVTQHPSLFMEVGPC